MLTRPRQDGAAVFLAGRTLAPVRAVAEEISAGGGTAQAAQVDALDEQAIADHVADVAATAGRADILFNAIGMEDVQGTPLLDLAVGDFMHPVITAARTQFLAARGGGPAYGAAAVGRDHVHHGRTHPVARHGRIHAARAAVEALWRGLACELGPHGIRLVIVRSAGSPDTPPRPACRPANTRPPRTTAPCCGGFPGSPKSLTPPPSWVNATASSRRSP